MERPALEIKQLKILRENRKILDVPHFALRKNECLVLFGPNGAGKSTFLRVISLLQSPDSGEIYYQDVKAGQKNRHELSRKVAYLLQKPVFFRGTVKDNLLLGLKFRGFDGSEQQKRLDKIAGLFNLDSLLDRSPLQLSGGEKQRVHLARAFILEPEFLFLDEPFNGLDVELRENLIHEFSRIRKTIGKTTILVTHNRDEAAYLADRLAVMISGEIVQVGTVEDVFSAPATPEISRLVGQEALVEGVVENSENGLLKILAHSQTVYALGPQKKGDRVVLTFRPEEVIIAREKPETSVRNWFFGTVSDIRSFDRMILVTIDCGFRLKAYISRASAEELKLGPGVKIWAGIKASALGTSLNIEMEESEELEKENDLL